MSLRILRQGSGSSRPLLIAYLVSDGVANQLASLLPPEAAVVVELTNNSYNRIGGDGVTPVSEVMSQLGITSASPLVIAGFSAGCQGVRAQLAAGERPDVALAADGIHSSNPPTAAQSEPWQRAKALAEAGQMFFGVSHSRVEAMQFLPTREAIRLILGVDTSEVGTPDDPVVQCSGGFCVYSVGGSDGEAHTAHQRVVLPRMLADALSGSYGGSSLRTWGKRAAFVLSLALGGALALWGLD